MWLLGPAILLSAVTLMYVEANTATNYTAESHGEGTKMYNE